MINRRTETKAEMNALEKFEYELKTTIFNVLYVLIKDD